jgi:NAD(P)-dependent dehydrogenase (short-subunit alcohol dehydrogenase family)
MGREAALALAESGKTVILVARNQVKLELLQDEIAHLGGNAVAVLCDFSDLERVKKAAEQILALDVVLVGMANNAGMQGVYAKKSAQGYELAAATNVFGPFTLAEMILPHLAAGARVEFTVSAVEDPERQFAVHAGFRGMRYTTIANMAQGIYPEGGSANPGFDSYATTKGALLACALQFAGEYPHLKVNALEPGLTLGTGLGVEAQKPVLKFIAKYILPLIGPLFSNRPNMSSPKKAGVLIARLVTTIDTTGVYYNEKGAPMEASKQMQDESFRAGLVADLRGFLKRE